VPQGAPTSPAITNLICRRMDARLSALAKKVGATYTRYADDLTFSFQKDPGEALKLGRFFWWIDQICQQEGFTENTKKRRVFRKSAQQRVTGIVVNEHLAVPRAQRRRFRAILSNVKKNGLEAEARGKDDLEAWLYLSYELFAKDTAQYVAKLRCIHGQQVLRESEGHGGPVVRGSRVAGAARTRAAGGRRSRS